jgi:hypothetical protein
MGNLFIEIETLGHRTSGYISLFIFFASKTRVVGEYPRSTSSLSRLKRADVTRAPPRHVHQSLVAADEEAMGLLRIIKPVVIARPPKYPLLTASEELLSSRFSSFLFLFRSRWISVSSCTGFPTLACF